MKKFHLLLSAAIVLALLAGCADRMPENPSSPAATTAKAVQTPAPQAETSAATPASTPAPTATPAPPPANATAAEIQDKVGVTYYLPDDAQDIVYSIIETNSGQAIAQATFSLNGIGYEYRMCPDQSLQDISGAQYDWATIKEIEIVYCAGEVKYTEGEQGICLWYDVVPGIIHSLYMDKDASEGMLLSVANKLFIPK